MPSRRTPDRYAVHRYAAQWDPRRAPGPVAEVPSPPASVDPEAYPAWTGGEIGRLGLVASVLIAPFAIGVPDPQARATPPSDQILNIGTATAGETSAGSLRAVRVTRFDPNALDAASFADAAD